MVSSVSVSVPIWFSLMRTELPTPSAMPFARIVGLVQKRSSPTNSAFLPSSLVSVFQPAQSFSAIPSSSSTMGYCFTHDDHKATISSEDFFDLSDLKNRYFPSSHISLVAGSRQIEMSSPGLYPALVIASRITSTASRLE